MPHKFWQAGYGKGVRKMVADGQHLRSVVDFAHHQVFRYATTYTAIHVLQRAPNRGTIDYTRIDDLSDGIAQCRELEARPLGPYAGMTRRNVSQLPVGPGEFVFSDSVNAVVATGTKRLTEVADLAQGFKTGADKVFVVTLIGIKGGIATIRSAESGTKHKVEVTCLRPLVKSEHMKAYLLLPSRLRLILPYAPDGERWSLIKPADMRRDFPLLWNDYLLPMRSALDRREKGRFAGEHFYQYSRPQNFAPLSKQKIINPDICEHPQMCWDAEGDHVFSGGAAGGVAIVPNDGVNPFYLLGVLNSDFADSWIRSNGTPFRGGYLNCEIRFIRNLPIKVPETADEKKVAARIIESVRALMAAKSKVRSPKLSDRERKTLESEIESHKHRIDEAVFALYGVKDLPKS